MGWGEASGGAALGRPGPLSEEEAAGGWWRAAPGGGLASLSPSSKGRPDGEEVGKEATGERWGPQLPRDGSGGNHVCCYLPCTLSLLRHVDNQELCSGRVCSVVRPAEMQGQDLEKREREREKEKKERVFLQCEKVG